MRLHQIVFVVTILYSLLLTGCSKQPPLNEDKFIKVYTDIVISQDTTARATLNQTKKQVFARNHITEKDYNATFKYYTENSEKWEAFFDKAIAYLESQRKKK